MGCDLDMRRRLPGLLVGLAAMVAVIAYRLVRGFRRPHPPKRTLIVNPPITDAARAKVRLAMLLDFGSASFQEVCERVLEFGMQPEIIGGTFCGPVVSC